MKKGFTLFKKSQKEPVMKESVEKEPIEKATNSEEINETVAKLRRDFIRSIVTLCVLLVVTGFASFAYFSKAWYASSKTTTAENSSIASQAAGQSIFIRLTGDGKDRNSMVQKSWAEDADAPALYPISTADCSDWYFISGWTLQSNTVNNVVTGKYVASEYSKAVVNDGLYTGLGDITRRAYYAVSYNIYTDDGEMDIYFDPDEPITITYAASAGKKLDEAIRVGFVVDKNENLKADDGELCFVYAPVDEAGTGVNMISATEMASPDTFYAVTGTDTAEVQSDIKVGKAGISDFLGKKIEGTDQRFEAGNSSIGTATEDGLNVIVYVWLEGMDAQAVLNVSDDEKNPLDITLKFVGVEK